MIKLKSHIHTNDLITYKIIKSNGINNQDLKILRFNYNYSLLEMLSLLRYCVDRKIELRII
jgi:hypothetical protein